MSLWLCSQCRKVTWDGFLYVTMQFCALSKLELCQAQKSIFWGHVRSMDG